MRSLSLFAGLVLLSAAVLGMLVFYGGYPIVFVAFPVPLVSVVAGTVGLSCCAFGGGATKDALGSAVVFGRSNITGRDCPAAIGPISGMIAYAYAIGTVLWLQNLLLTMGTLSTVMKNGLTEQFGARVACGIFIPISSVVLAECFLRPLRHRLTYLASQRNPADSNAKQPALS
jgi:hypothetical protein